MWFDYLGFSEVVLFDDVVNCDVVCDDFCVFVFWLVDMFVIDEV